MLEKSVHTTKNTKKHTVMKFGSIFSTRDNTYLHPEAELIEVKTERGFAASEQEQEQRLGMQDDDGDDESDI